MRINRRRKGVAVIEFTLVMFPILLLMYGRLAITEEADMRAQFGNAYESYVRRTPRFFPRMGQGLSAG